MIGKNASLPLLEQQELQVCAPDMPIKMRKKKKKKPQQHSHHGTSRKIY